MRTLVEIQSFRDNRLVYILTMTLLLLPFLLLIVGFVKTERINEEEWVGSLIGMVSLLGAVVLLTCMKSYLKLEEKQLVYRTNPLWKNRKTINRSKVEQWYIANHRWQHGLGYKMLMSGGWAYVMKPGKVLVVKTRDGRNYRFGINRPKLVERFLETNWEEGNQMQYG